ncbi:molybdopterin biosynthesis MoeA protein [Alcanivorax hongdengensis A-11-3]|uniref:Molybdopterin molybdenumtransferase n=1 Tax=Alcanivorax hongdengensis A-11-3 TaxID=1177179 RepID=L0WES3_9GAMM|nr:gephyrin-like molybdotransferase Glp [Alcanivorax hongdengensis]EKF75516.1 molybdopterin biosynthesis MoeA protein [Alcanivorax hongdengensis A-11-3]
MPAGDIPARLMPVSEALSRLLDSASPFRAVRDLPLSECRGQYLAHDVVSRVDVPAFDNAAVDGVALRFADLDEPGLTLPMPLRIAAGDPPATLMPGQVARIFTGAPVPAGADTVLMQEDCELADGRVRLPGRDRVSAGQNIRPAGQDAGQGQVVMERGQRLTPQALGLIASVGCATVTVNAPRVLILTSGDEIQAPDETPLPGKIFDSNGPLLEQLLRQSGFPDCRREHLPDDPAMIENTLTRVLTDPQQRPDVIISTGGVSVGEEDHLRAVLEKQGRLDFWRLAIKPGKPFTYGHVDGIPLFGLPGNPSAVLVCYLMLVLPTLRRCCGAASVLPAPLSLPADFAIPRPGKRQEYLRVRCVNQGGQLSLEKHPNQSSGMLSSAVWADGLAVVPVGATVIAGDRLDYFSFAHLLN